MSRYHKHLPIKLDSCLQWQKPGSNRIAKITALFITAAFLFPYLAWAFEKSSYPLADEITFNQQIVEIPGELGEVNAVHRAGGTLVVCVQDLHCNYEVQTNIAKLIDHLAQKHGLRLVAVEGAWLPINVTKLSTFPVQSVKEDIGNYLMKQGEITGPEYYAATGKHKVRLEGIEQAELYQANQQAVAGFLSDESQGHIYDLRDALQEIKAQVYNRELAGMDEKRRAYRENRLSLLRYSVHLAGLAARRGIPLAGCEQLSRYLAIKTDSLPQEVDSETLFAELDQLEMRVRAGLYTRPEQEELDRLEQRLDIIEKMVNISATPEDLAEYHAAREQFRAEKFLAFISRYDDTAELLPADGVLELNRCLSRVEAFYRVADQRSRAFVDNTLQRLQAQDLKLAMLVYGGYHTRDVLAGLKSRGASFVSVTPRLTRQDVVNPYFALLRNRRTPLEKLLAKHQNIFALQSRYGCAQDPDRILSMENLPKEKKLHALKHDVLAHVFLLKDALQQRIQAENLLAWIEAQMAGWPARAAGIKATAAEVRKGFASLLFSNRIAALAASGKNNIKNMPELTFIDMGDTNLFITSAESLSALQEACAGPAARARANGLPFTFVGWQQSVNALFTHGGTVLTMFGLGQVMAKVAGLAGNVRSLLQPGGSGPGAGLGQSPDQDAVGGKRRLTDIAHTVFNSISKYAVRFSLIIGSAAGVSAGQTEFGLDALLYSAGTSMSWLFVLPALIVVGAVIGMYGVGLENKFNIVGNKYYPLLGLGLFLLTGAAMALSGSIWFVLGTGLLGAGIRSSKHRAQFNGFMNRVMNILLIFIPLFMLCGLFITAIMYGDGMLDISGWLHGVQSVLGLLFMGSMGVGYLASYRNQLGHNKTLMLAAVLGLAILAGYAFGLPGEIGAFAAAGVVKAAMPGMFFSITAEQPRELPGSFIDIIAQRITAESAPRTGEITLEDALAAGATGIFAGHADVRRNFKRESDRAINRQIRAAHKHKVPTVALIVNDSLRQYKAGISKEVIKTQVLHGLQGLTAEEVAKTVIAYEPKRSLELEKPLSPEETQEMAAYIRSLIKEKYGPDAARKVRIGYGNYVDKNNARSYLEQTDIDVLFIGLAGMDVNEFKPIVEIAREIGPKDGRVPYIGANWKTKEVLNGYEEFVAALGQVDQTKVQVGIAPSAAAISQLAGTVAGRKPAAADGWQKYLPGVALVAERISTQEGFFTGEVPVRDIIKAGANALYAGTLQARAGIKGEEAQVNEQIKTAHAAGLKTVALMVGDASGRLDSGAVEARVKNQVLRGLEGLSPEEAAKTMIVYQTSNQESPLDPAEVQKMAGFIRELIGEQEAFGRKVAGKIRIIYGDDVTCENAEDYLRQPDIDGVFIGPSGMQPEAFEPLMATMQDIGPKHGRVPYLSLRWQGKSAEIHEFQKYIEILNRVNSKKVEVGIVPSLAAINHVAQNIWNHLSDLPMAESAKHMLLLERKFGFSFADVVEKTRNRIFAQPLEELDAKVGLWVTSGIQPHPLMLSESLDALPLSIHLTHQLRREAISEIYMRALKTAEQTPLPADYREEALGEEEATRIWAAFAAPLQEHDLSAAKYSGKYSLNFIKKIVMPILAKPLDRESATLVGTYGAARATATLVLARKIIPNAYKHLAKKEATAKDIQLRFAFNHSRMIVRALDYLASPDAPGQYAGVDKKMTDQGVVYYLAYAGGAAERTRQAVAQRKRLAHKYNIVFWPDSPAVEEQAFSQDDADLEKKMEALCRHENMPLYPGLLNFSIPTLDLLALMYSPEWLEAAAPIMASAKEAAAEKGKEVETETNRLEFIVDSLQKYVINNIRQGETITALTMAELFGIEEQKAAAFLDYLASADAEGTILAGIDKRIRPDGRVEYYQAYNPQFTTAKKCLALLQRKQLAARFEVVFPQYTAQRLEYIFSQDMSGLVEKSKLLEAHKIKPHPVLLAQSLDTLWIAAPIIQGKLKAGAADNPQAIYGEVLAEAMGKLGKINDVYNKLKTSKLLTLDDLLKQRMFTSKEEALTILEYLASPQAWTSAEYPGVFKRAGDRGEAIYKLVFTYDQLKSARDRILGQGESDVVDLGVSLQVSPVIAELILVTLSSEDARASEAWGGVCAGKTPEGKTVYYKAFERTQIQLAKNRLRQGATLTPGQVGEDLGISVRRAGILLEQLLVEMPEMEKTAGEDGTISYRMPAEGTKNVNVKDLALGVGLGVALLLAYAAVTSAGLDLPEWLASGSNPAVLQSVLPILIITEAAKKRLGAILTRLSALTINTDTTGMPAFQNISNITVLAAVFSSGMLLLAFCLGLTPWEALGVGGGAMTLTTWPLIVINGTSRSRADKKIVVALSSMLLPAMETTRRTRRALDNKSRLDRLSIETGKCAGKIAAADVYKDLPEIISSDDLNKLPADAIVVSERGIRPEDPPMAFMGGLPDETYLQYHFRLVALGGRPLSPAEAREILGEAQADSIGLNGLLAAVNQALKIKLPEGGTLRVESVPAEDDRAGQVKIQSAFIGADRISRKAPDDLVIYVGANATPGEVLAIIQQQLLANIPSDSKPGRLSRGLIFEFYRSLLELGMDKKEVREAVFDLARNDNPVAAMQALDVIVYSGWYFQAYKSIKEIQKSKSLSREVKDYADFLAHLVQSIIYKEPFGGPFNILYDLVDGNPRYLVVDKNSRLAASVIYDLDQPDSPQFEIFSQARMKEIAGQKLKPPMPGMRAAWEKELSKYRKGGNTFTPLLQSLIVLGMVLTTAAWGLGWLPVIDILNQVQAVTGLDLSWWLAGGIGIKACVQMLMSIRSHPGGPVALGAKGGNSGLPLTTTQPGSSTGFELDTTQGPGLAPGGPGNGPEPSGPDSRVPFKPDHVPGKPDIGIKLPQPGLSQSGSNPAATYRAAGAADTQSRHPRLDIVTDTTGGFAQMLADPAAGNDVQWNEPIRIGDTSLKLPRRILQLPLLNLPGVKQFPVINMLGEAVGLLLLGRMPAMSMNLAAINNEPVIRSLVRSYFPQISAELLQDFNLQDVSIEPLTGKQGLVWQAAGQVLGYYTDVNGRPVIYLPQNVLAILMVQPQGGREYLRYILALKLAGHMLAYQSRKHHGDTIRDILGLTNTHQAMVLDEAPGEVSLGEMSVLAGAESMQGEVMFTAADLAGLVARVLAEAGALKGAAFSRSAQALLAALQNREPNLKEVMWALEQADLSQAPELAAIKAALEQSSSLPEQERKLIESSVAQNLLTIISAATNAQERAARPVASSQAVTHVHMMNLAAEQTAGLLAAVAAAKKEFKDQPGMAERLEVVEAALLAAQGDPAQTTDLKLTPRQLGLLAGEIMQARQDSQVVALGEEANLKSFAAVSGIERVDMGKGVTAFRPVMIEVGADRATAEDVRQQVAARKFAPTTMIKAFAGYEPAPALVKDQGPILETRALLLLAAIIPALRPRLHARAMRLHPQWYCARALERIRLEYPELMETVCAQQAADLNSQTPLAQKLRDLTQTGEARAQQAVAKTMIRMIRNQAAADPAIEIKEWIFFSEFFTGLESVPTVAIAAPDATQPGWSRLPKTWQAREFRVPVAMISVGGGRWALGYAIKNLGKYCEIYNNVLRLFLRKHLRLSVRTMA